MVDKIPLHLRQNAICEIAQKSQNISISDLATKFNVSEMTIHRDLSQLEQENLIRRHRGFIKPAERMEFEFDFATRRRSNNKYKKAIAACALKFVKPENKIILDTGTTTLEVAYLLENIDNLTVITPSIAVASVLQFTSNVHTILLGGDLIKGAPDLTGILTKTNLDMFIADVTFQGIDGIGLNGELFNADIRLAEVDKKMRSRSKQNYILCDSSKIGKTEFASNGYLKEITALITDKKIKPDQLEQLKKYTNVIVAS